MPIKELRVRNYRAFKDTGKLNFDHEGAIVGRNDVGKSGLLHALNTFFNPPKRGGLPLTDFHAGNDKDPVVVEIGFDPSSLSGSSVKLDAKNESDLVKDRLLDKSNLLRLRLSLSRTGKVDFEVLIHDVDCGELFPLAMKAHDDLLTGLQKIGHKAVKAGKETNQEKRSNLREYYVESGKQEVERWVSALEVENALRAVLPEFVFYADDADYAIDKTGVQNQFKSVVDKAMAKHVDAKKIEDEIRGTVQGEFDKIQERMVRLTDTVTSVKAIADVSWKKAVDGIGIEWEDSSGVSLPFHCRGAGVRRLFMVAYFQYVAAEYLHDENGTKYIFAIEEPEVHLHPGAQELLKQAFEELVGAGHAVFYATHSPVFASRSPAGSLVLVKRGAAKVSECHQRPALDLTAVASELGVEPSHRLVGKNYIVLVEGKDDVGVLTEFLQKTHAGGKTQLDPDDVLFLQCGGIDNLKFNANAKCMTDAGLKWAVVIDSDRASANQPPQSKAAKELDANTPQGCSLVHVLEKSAIENYLDAAKVYQASGVQCLIPSYGKPTDLNGNELSGSVLKAVKRNGPTAASLMSLAEIEACSLTQTGTCEMTELFNTLATEFGLTK